MVTKTSRKISVQSTAKIPTVQDRKDAVAIQLLEIKDSVTPEMLEKAARRLGIIPKTAKEYLNGRVAFLHRGEMLLSTLRKELKGIAIAK